MFFDRKPYPWFRPSFPSSLLIPVYFVAASFPGFNLPYSPPFSAFNSLRNCGSVEMWKWCFMSGHKLRQYHGKATNKSHMQRIRRRRKKFRRVRDEIWTQDSQSSLHWILGENRGLSPQGGEHYSPIHSSKPPQGCAVPSLSSFGYCSHLIQPGGWRMAWWLLSGWFWETWSQSNSHLLASLPSISPASEVKRLKPRF